MALSAPTTPRSNFATPRKPKLTETTPRHKPPPSHTPECFTSVTMDTPSAKRCSKDKFDEVSNLTVAVRIRPMNARELAHVGATDIVRVRDQDVIIRSQPSSVTGLDHIFQYDHVFWSCDEKTALYSTQERVFLTIGKPLLNSAFRGYNACLFAYGQTGSGKSFSMMGRDIDIDSEEFAGITPRFCKELFTRIKNLGPDCSASVEVSYFEIYNEKIHDLLADQNTNRVPLKVREHPVWGPYVVDLSVHQVQSYKEIRSWLQVGNGNRATAATMMNEKSSRSHSLFSIELCLTDGVNQGDSCRRSRVSLVDLAGSERLGSSGNSEEKIRQGVCINKSLLTLGKVISALADQKRNQFVPYRDSVLTWLLRESLGGNSLTSMLATITPASTHMDETLATLRYACQARSIINRARINENPHDRLIRELRTEVERLRALRQDYERHSTSATSLTSIYINEDSSSNTTEEMEDLRSKLTDTENKLLEAEKCWQQRFMETKQSQLRELAEAEKRKEELESKMRVLKTVKDDVNLSPYRTNFLKELEGVLTEEGNVEVEIVEDIRRWCLKNGMNCSWNSESLIVSHVGQKRQAVLLLRNLKSRMAGFENLSDFIDSLNWCSIGKKSKKISKSDVMSSMNRIYEVLNGLQPNDSENDLCLLFAKVNKSLQSFEAALLNNVSRLNGPKTVTFNCD